MLYFFRLLLGLDREGFRAARARRRWFAAR